MSLSYNSYHIDSNPSKKTREELEKYKKSLHRPAEFYFSYSSSPINLKDINWDLLKGVDFSQGGSSPLFLCGFPDNEACIVKGLGPIVEDIFTSQLFALMNIHVQKFRVIQHTHPEFRKILNSMRGVAVYDLYTDHNICKELDRPFFMLQEYQPGIYFLQMGKKRAEQCFGSDPELGFRRLREIGEIIAMDIWLNNSGRVPVIWNTEGNPNNLLIGVQGVNLTSASLLDPDYPITMDHIYAIDSACNCLSRESENSERIYAQYLERVERFARGTVRDLEEALQGKTLGLLTLPCLETVKEFFYKSTRVMLDNHQLFQVLKGVMGTFKEIAGVDDEEIQEVCNEVRGIPREDWMEVWENGMSKINVEFLIDVRDTIRRIVEGNQKSFEWTYQMYKIDDSPLYF